MEHTQITFEWTVNGLANLFDSSAGPSKSKLYKSPRFGPEGQWQVLLYPNAGTSKEGQVEGIYASLFLSSEPTSNELEAAVMNDGQWIRRGVYKFCFEIRTLKKQVLFNQKEASNHIFSHKTANWGWAQFARRDVIYYGAPATRLDDAFVIVCTIISSPAPPTQPPPTPMREVPHSFLDRIGELLGDPNYSDVKFILPQRSGPPRSIFAAKKVLEGVEYFQTMFGADFIEGASSSRAGPSHGGASSDYEEEDRTMEDSDSESISDSSEDPETSIVGENGEYILSDSTAIPQLTSPVSPNENSSEETGQGGDQPHQPIVAQNLRTAAPLVHSPVIEDDRRKMRQVTLRDCSFATFFSILYYLYTDSIYFAPLSSSFMLGTSHAHSPPSNEDIHQTLRSYRKEWIKEFQKRRPGKPVCSAKACYRLADRFGLSELKEKAARHIRTSLTADNIVYEIFSPFTAVFPELRQFEVEFFLENWSIIRTSPAMKQVWKQIRHGRHPGYEEVWPAIASQLEFKPQTKAGASGTGNDE